MSYFKQWEIMGEELRKIDITNGPEKTPELNFNNFMPQKPQQ